MKWDTDNITTASNTSEEEIEGAARIWFCARYVGISRLLLLPILAATFLTFIRHGPENDPLSWLWYTGFAVSLLVMLPLHFVIVLSADEHSIFKPTRFGKSCICDLKDVTRIRKTGFGAFGYHFWVMEYRHSIDEAKKVRFIPRKKGVEFATFLGWVRTVNPNVIVQE